MMEGDITVESTVGLGSSFTVKAKMKRCTDKDKLEDSVKHVASIRDRILKMVRNFRRKFGVESDECQNDMWVGVVEKNDSQRMALVKTLRSMGLKCVHAFNVEEMCLQPDSARCRLWFVDTNQTDDDITYAEKFCESRDIPLVSHDYSLFKSMSKMTLTGDVGEDSRIYRGFKSTE